MHVILAALEPIRWSSLALFYALLSIGANLEPQQDYQHSRNPQTQSPVRSPASVKALRPQELDNRPWECPAKKALSPVSVE